MSRLLWLVAVLVLTAPAAASASQSACGRLRGHDLAPARSVKLVERPFRYGTELVSCSLPHGPVHRLASVASGSLFAEDIHVRAVAGAFAALTHTTDDQYASTEETHLVDLRSGRSRTVAAFAHDVGSGPQATGTQALVIAVTPGGRAAAAIGDFASATTAIVGFGARGAPRVLDRGAPADLMAASLTLTGSTVGWTDAGGARSAPLP